MLHRGSQYWEWSNCRLPIHSHDEVLSDGTQLNVLVRVSRNGVTQAFIGIYDGAGRMKVEEYHDSQLGSTTSYALAWGIYRARALATFSAAARSA